MRSPVPELEFRVGISVLEKNKYNSSLQEGVSLSGAKSYYVRSYSFTISDLRSDGGDVIFFRVVLYEILTLFIPQADIQMQSSHLLTNAIPR